MGRYGIKDVFVTLQGEGMRAGTKAVFIRFTGCNLWDGLPLHRDRGQGSCARWCDTDFFKGRAVGEGDIAELADAAWGNPIHGEKWCVLTGGEPCLQIDDDLIEALQEHGWRVAIETNGTEHNNAAYQADHICIAPKLDTQGKPLELLLERANEIKVVLPGAMPGEPGWTTDMLATLEMKAKRMGYPRLFVQPQDPIVDPKFVGETRLVRTVAVHEDIEDQLAKQYDRNLRRCIDHVMANPRWALSLQSHKLIGVP